MEVHRILNENQEELFRAMARIPEGVQIPDYVLERLLKHKKLLDRVGGTLKAEVLAEILVGLGFDPDTNSFEGKDPIQIPEEPIAVDSAETVEVEPEETVEEEPEVFPEDDQPKPKFNVGDTATVLHNNEKVSCEITDVTIQDEDVWYTVDIDDSMVMKEEVEFE